jgi:hypothetical protein
MHGNGEALAHKVQGDLLKYSKTLQTFDNYISSKNGCLLCIVQVHAKKISIEINKWPSSPSLADK